MTPSSTETLAIPAGELIQTMTPDQVSEAIKAAGCSVTAIDNEGVTHLHSASQGVGFQVLWGAAAVPGEYADFTLSCPLRIRGGTLPPETISEWHRTRRFARVAQHGDFVVLEMDVLAAGGISTDHLTVMLRLWTQMMGWFLLHLRNFEPPAASVTGADAQGAASATAGASVSAADAALPADATT